jgi:hypothetical protein
VVFVIWDRNYRGLWRAEWYYDDRRDIRRDCKTRLEMENLVDEFEPDDGREGKIAWVQVPESGGTVVEKWTKKS